MIVDNTPSPPHRCKHSHVRTQAFINKQVKSTCCKCVRVLGSLLQTAWFLLASSSDIFVGGAGGAALAASVRAPERGAHALGAAPRAHGGGAGVPRRGPFEPEGVRAERGHAAPTQHRHLHHLRPQGAVPGRAYHRCATPALHSRLPQSPRRA